MARLRGFRPQIRSQRRKANWTVGPQSGADGVPIALSASSKVLMGVGAVVLDSGITLVRTRGELMILLKTSSNAAGGFVGAFGLCVVTDQAFAAGVGSIPGPVADDDWDGWFYHRYLALGSGGAIAAAAAADEDQVNSVTAALRVEVDSKAMRKLTVGQTIVGMLELAEQGTATASIFFNSRMLVKLP